MKIAVIGVGGLGGYYGGLLWRAGHDVAFIESQRRSIEACSVLCYHAGREMASGAVKSGPEA